MSRRCDHDGGFEYESNPPRPVQSLLQTAAPATLAANVARLKSIQNDLDALLPASCRGKLWVSDLREGSLILYTGVGGIAMMMRYQEKLIRRGLSTAGHGEISSVEVRVDPGLVSLGM